MTHALVKRIANKTICIFRLITVLRHSHSHHNHVTGRKKFLSTTYKSHIPIIHCVKSVIERNHFLPFKWERSSITGGEWELSESAYLSTAWNNTRPGLQHHGAVWRCECCISYCYDINSFITFVGAGLELDPVWIDRRSNLEAVERTSHCGRSVTQINYNIRVLSYLFQTM